MFSYFDRDEAGISPEQNKTVPNKIWFMVTYFGKVWNTSTLDGIPTSPSGDRDVLSVFPTIATVGQTLVYGDYKITIIEPPT